MNCEHVRQSIDLLVFEPATSFDPAFKRHLDNCDNCMKYYHASVNDAKLIGTLQQNQPHLENPEGLTSNILSAIENDETEISLAGNQPTKLFNMATRLLAAASVVLFLAFGFEQYMVLEKMQKLEATSKKMIQQNSPVPSWKDLQTLSTSQLRKILQRTEIEETDIKGLLALLSNGKISAKEINKLEQFRHFLPEDQLRLFNLLKYYN